MMNVDNSGCVFYFDYSKFYEWIDSDNWSDYFGGTINSIYVKRRVISIVVI